MNMEEVKNDVKHIQISKNTLICVLSVALVLVSAIAIGLAFDGHEGRGERGGRMGMMEKGYGNLNDGEGNYGEKVPINTTMKPVQTTPTVPAITQTAPKQ